MISERQERLLNFLVKEYISTAEPVSSLGLKKIINWDVCGATIRNDLQALTEEGYIEQPHTSAGRIPTKKAYQYFADKIASQQENTMHDFIFKEIEKTRQQIESEMRRTQELMNSLSEISTTLNYTRITKSDNFIEILEILGPSKSTHNKNIDAINKIIKELEKW